MTTKQKKERRWKEMMELLSDLKSLKISQYKTSHDTDIAWTTIQRWKPKEHYPSEKHLKKIRKYYRETRKKIKQSITNKANYWLKKATQVSKKSR